MSSQQTAAPAANATMAKIAAALNEIRRGGGFNGIQVIAMAKQTLYTFDTGNQDLVTAPQIIGCD